jgi:NADP-dependent 3-hydroxy acid dehydrogenase YdfG
MKRAVVVGASSGMGMRIARLLLADGWTVGVAARRQERLEEIRNDYPERAIVSKIDVNSDDAGAQLASLFDEIGGCDLYFHASGIGKINTNLEPEIEINTLKTNGLGFVRMVTAAFNYMSQHGGGHIAVISSIAGTKGLSPAPAYSATKAMQNNYIQALEQLANTRKLNIRFTDIRPGFVRTDLLGDTKFPIEMEPDFVAKHIYKAVMHNRHVCIIDWRWAFIVFLWRLLPKCIWRRMKLNIQ